MYDLSKVVVTSSPHLKNPEGTRSIMIDVIIALCPALAAGVYMYGARALFITLLSVVSCIFFEGLYCKLTKKRVTIGDLSSIVTGMLIAFNVPVTVPFWLVIVGSAFAIIVVKMLFGGIGKNFMNPALAARAFLLACWGTAMTTWVSPIVSRTVLPIFTNVDTTSSAFDAISTATPLSQMKDGILPTASIRDMAFGQIGGCIGETSAILLLAGGLYLVIRKVITLTIPVSYIATVAVLTFLFPPTGVDAYTWMCANLCAGGLMLGAMFMATDYTTSPITKKGQVIFGIGCGLLTVFIRSFGSYPEGVSYSILVMNVLVWLIDKYTVPTKFGTVKPPKKVKEVKEAN